MDNTIDFHKIGNVHSRSRSFAGGTMADPEQPGYSFFRNFFSELGLTRSYLGEPNTISFVLFTVALAGAGLGIMLLFAVFPSFFQRRAAKILAILGSIAGIFSGSHKKHIEDLLWFVHCRDRASLFIVRLGLSTTWSTCTTVG